MKNHAQIKLKQDMAQRIDAVVTRQPMFVNRSHFVRVAIEQLLAKHETKSRKEAA